MRLYPRAEFQRARYSLEECDHRRSFALAQSLSDLVFQGWNQPVDPGDQRWSGGRQPHVEGSPVLLVSVSSRPACRLQVVYQADHVVAVDPEGVSELLLGLRLSHHNSSGEGDVPYGPSEPAALDDAERVPS